MSSSIRSSSIFLFFFVCASVSKPWNLEEAAEKLGKVSDTKSLRISRDSEDVLPIWLDYEFNTGAGNREELVVTNISVHEHANLPETGTNWQFLEVNGTGYLTRTEKSRLSFHKLDSNNVPSDDPVVLDVQGAILMFKVISLNSFRSTGDPEINVVAVLCVESKNGTLLQWYRFLDGKSFQFFWSSPVQKYIKDIEIVQHGNRNKLLLLDENEMRFGKQYSYIDVYGFSIDFSINAFHFWLSQRIPMPRVFDIEVCTIYESIVLALQGVSDVFLYEYRDTAMGGVFQTIKSQDLKNFVCFESGYIQFLAISGPEAGLFHFFEGEFQYNTESESNFDVSEISWIKDVSLDTYRDESLLLIQFRNFTVIALGWQGTGFKRIELPNSILDQFDLSMVTVIPKFGFVLGNRFVRFHIDLKNLRHQSQHTMERLLSLQSLLNDTLNHQERIINETEMRIDKSYLKNPVITGFWNVSEANVTNATITDNVIYRSVTIGSTNLTREELNFNVNTYAQTLKDIKKKVDEIDANLIKAVDSNSTNLHFDSDVEVFGNINIVGNLNIEDLVVQSINDVDKTFLSIEGENLTIHALNGVPVKDIRFGNSIEDYRGVNFSRINRAYIEEHLSFETINSVEWKTLMEEIVWKNKPAFIPGNTVIEGTLIADDVYLEILNDLQYPDDYVLRYSEDPVNVIGLKSFDSLTVGNLNVVSTINGIDVDDFILLHKDNVLSKEITFENLEVEGSMQLDGEIVGLDTNEIELLNETSEVSTDTIFSNLNVLGSIRFEKLIVDKQPLNLEDLLLKTDKNVRITGTKTFLGNVGIKSNVTIESGEVNGHFINEFLTLTTDQDLPNLTKILSNVTFGNVTFGAAKKLEVLLKENANSSSNCLEKIVFKYPITVDDLSFDSLNGKVSQEEFARKFNETFQNIRLENLTTETLEAEEIAPKILNNVSSEDYINRLKSLSTIQEYTVENLETHLLDVKFINGMSLDEIGRLMDRLNALLADFSSGNATLESLRVTGKIDAKSINGQVLKDLYEANQMGTMIFKQPVSIEKLTILGSTNGYNFSERLSDTILKSDTDIKISGHKIFDFIYCHDLKTISLNGHPVDSIFDPFKDQVLTGPVVVNGSVTVLKKFNATGKIGNVPFRDLMDRFKSLGNNSFEFQGNVRFSKNVSIDNLVMNGTIQGVDFESFLKTTVSKDEDNLTISGTKVFDNRVIFDGPFFVQDKLNDIDLKTFMEKAIFVDKPLSVESKIVFKDGITIEKELTVKTDFAARSIMGVDVDDLKLNVLYLNKPTYIKETITFSNVTFNSDIEVSKFNDLDTRLLIPLHTDQTIPVEVLKCRNVTVESIEIMGKINDESLKEIQEKTFMAIGNQNITGHINFHGHVHAGRNFNARLLNGIDPTRMIPLNSKSKFIGNLVFEKPVTMNQGLRVLGYFNGIDPNRWQAVALSTNNGFQQIVSGKWTVIGNVQFKKGASGSDILNGINVTQLTETLDRRRLEMDAAISDRNENLNGACEDLRRLKHYAEKQIYKFSSFDYLREIIEFDSRIVSLHYFELDDLDYLLISFHTCQMQMYLIAGTKFELVADVPNFGIVDRWSTYNHDGALYFLTSGTKSCGRSSENLWKLENDELTHVASLGQKVNSRKMHQDDFLSLIKDEDGKQSLTDEQVSLHNYQTLFNSRQAIHDYNVDTSNDTSIQKRFGNAQTLNFKAGVFEKQMSLYYNEEVSKDRAFICNNDSTKKILQTIRAHRPSSFTILNFEGSIETLLVFVENGKILQIYEYKGIQGFVYRDSIRINVDKLISFRIRKYPNLAKRHCLALVHGIRLTILEANMYGEKLDMEPLTCSGEIESRISHD
ncbi:female sterile (1) Nasrat [Colletes latitarsis]|uniref:female sterile (1) Nasrat n=1 Tax=Colletes latitarsis TaxID=2605962 RepID=UPI004035FD58